ncbi:uncharacterized protein EI97DRAFT_277040 [Westerdykella ornata]|uniref:Prolyl 4-hydroxylase alpha subunit domain-containing protein n=1 Tax=Westerdykella ornata TaxID=318751 RepID=A0A6A6JQC3_WESOR|nr:uncharacterized protein EI97DRAFT_277040 [Westerdykella ornata]KAF2277886.1 hypothetical protein EI97DRAFT_277040 [Westerdykella ornata]
MSDTNPASIELPADFLRTPGPKVTKETIDFKAAGLREYEDYYAVVLDGVLSEEECNTLVSAVDASVDGRWERAMINSWNGSQRMREDIRKCGRVIVDDRDLMRRLWARVEGAVPELERLVNWANITGMGPASRGEVWAMTRLNERARFLKYVGGEYFKPHGDGQYQTEDGFERSYFTLHLYLNDGAGKDGAEPLEGGATVFHSHCDKDLKVEPKVGRVLLFQQRCLIHSGEDVVKGTKLTMRTDIMYARKPNDRPRESEKASESESAREPEDKANQPSNNAEEPTSNGLISAGKKLFRNPFH